ncbi:gamma carbonic anhydrase family protein [Agreia sp. VKM Ac-1783]|uniref:gamma carbonic anhydrase family protein n=1 Tax=Agreia sp. VKM Ac-1783 TaxID=1938889 RepID=UPI000A2AE91A|nr:gamma carbonic anhydrase family protein [Agreia sp. VKM Ac-1783]SMQ68526.1 Carbonic anhydrase or acetyltransferase, isoleucine patch superfamily [Agreia sp. VKM Ac-1783]
MLYESRGARPRVDPDALVAASAVVSGDVTIGPGSRVMHGAVLTAEDGPIVIGANVVVLENAVIRGRAGHAAIIDDGVMVGPHTHVNGCTIGTGAFLATGASVFPGAVVGEGAEVRINAVVQVNTRLAAGAVVPISWVAVGDPAQLFSPDRHDEIWAVQRTLDFVGTVYGAGADATMKNIMRSQSEFYGAHRADVELLG